MIQPKLNDETLHAPHAILLRRHILCRCISASFIIYNKGCHAYPRKWCRRSREGKLMTEHEVTLMKPMGIILEEDEDNPALGVVVRRIDPHGHAAVACRFDPEGVDICVRDTLVEVNGRDITRKTLEEIIAIIRDGPDRVELRLRRPYDAVIVRWANGISVAAQPGDSVGYIAQHEALVKISYSCTSGGCGSCEQSIIDEDGNSQRYIRPCVARVPKGSPIIIVNPSDRFVAP